MAHQLKVSLAAFEKLATGAEASRVTAMVIAGTDAEAQGLNML